MLHFGGQNPLRQKPNFTSAFNAIPPVQSACEKYSAWRVGQISRIVPLIPPRSKRGVSRSSRTLRRGAVAARHRERIRASTSDVVRTVKPRGPGAPWLALNSLMLCIKRMTVATKSGSPGRSRSKPSNHRAGKAGYQRLNLWFLPRAFFYARGPWVSVDTRSSLRPLDCEGLVSAKLGRHRRCETAPACARCSMVQR
jgi:hypothetical protein